MIDIGIPDDGDTGPRRINIFKTKVNLTQKNKEILEKENSGNFKGKSLILKKSSRNSEKSKEKGKEGKVNFTQVEKVKEKENILNDENNTKFNFTEHKKKNEKEGLDEEEEEDKIIEDNSSSSDIDEKINISKPQSSHIKNKRVNITNSSLTQALKLKLNGNETINDKLKTGRIHILKLSGENKSNTIGNSNRNSMKVNKKINILNETFSPNTKFIHCRNCMLIIAVNKSKQYFNN